MKRNMTALLLSGALLLAMGTQALAAPQIGVEPISAVVKEESETAAPAAKDSVLYYGRVKAIDRDEEGGVIRLLLESERYGAYIMNIDTDTVWIDSGNRTRSDPADLAEEEGLYVFRSSVSTRSMVPQSKAFAVVRNIPEDAGCAMYHVVEAVESAENGGTRLVTDNGSLYLFLRSDTTLSHYRSGEAAVGSDVQPGDRVMAWYGPVEESYPGQAYPSHIMLLPRAEERPQGADNCPWRWTASGGR